MKVSVALGLFVIFSSPLWISQGVATVNSIGENTIAIAANIKAINALTESVGGMVQLFGNAEVLEDGSQLTTAINTYSDAVRFREGQRLIVTNTSDRSETTIRVTVLGKFESDPFHLLNLSAAAGRAIRASQDKIQVAIEPAEE